VTVGIAQVAEDGYQRFGLPHLDEAAVAGAHKVVDILGGPSLARWPPSICTLTPAAGICSRGCSSNPPAGNVRSVPASDCTLSTKSFPKEPEVPGAANVIYKARGRARRRA
jgi:hypothetical protein